MASSAELELISRKIRGKLVELSHKAQTPHLGGSLSCVDILVSILWGGHFSLDPQRMKDPDRDHLIFSKGHAATALYTALTYRGFGQESILDTYAEPGSPLGEHPSPGCMNGVEVGTGSLGHGLPIATGMALAARLDNRKSKFAVVLSDGESEEGSVWEAALFAAAQKLDRIAVVVDYNKWQATGRSNQIMALDPFKEKWSSFGWDAMEVDGHNITELVNALGQFPSKSGKPSAIIAHTIKGKGVSFMQDDNNWHYRSPTSDEVQKAKMELGLV